MTTLFNPWDTTATVRLPDGRQHTTSHVTGFSTDATRAAARADAAALARFTDPQRPMLRWTMRIRRDVGLRPWVKVHLVYAIDGSDAFKAAKVKPAPTS